MRLSCIVPVWNHGWLLAEALASLASQTHPVDEILVIDDASTDDSFVVGCRFATAHGPGAHVFRNGTRLGVCESLRRWLPRTTGDWILRLDADDVLEPDFVERHVAAITDDPRLGIVWAPAVYFATEPDIERRDLVGQLVATQPWNLGDVASSTSIHCSALVRRAALEDVGWCVAAEREEDRATWIAIARAGWTGTNIGMPPALHYRLHSGGSRNFGTDHRREGLTAASAAIVPQESPR